MCTSAWKRGQTLQFIDVWEPGEVASGKIPGAKKHLHGHTYRVQVGIFGSPDGRGIVMDFHDTKEIWKKH
ncbi:6-carboxytetrahydropterin synthase [Alicyclobacillus macrosporangiidus]|uniref:6-carboxytetrahydropterin synthase n=1 Tax=Alicyclobacillus macrosporangiidus TaxID=392015 RepID=UPI000A7E8A84|nr:6-carboxytetrahydropterin synthase [Alicyclobacillus macrosporangiidus]